MPKSTLVVIGASGIQGVSVVDAFVTNPGWHVRAVTRNPHSEKAQALIRKGCEVVRADLNDLGSLRDAFQGATAIFAVTNYWEPFFDSGIASRLKSGQSIPQYCYEEEVRLGINLAEAATACADTLTHYIWSTLSSPARWSKGKYTQILHFEAKAAIADYIRQKLPQLATKMSEIQIAFYATNLFYYDLMRPHKQEDGSFRIDRLVPKEANLPFIDTRRDTGRFVKALTDRPAGISLLAYTAVVSFSQLAEILGRVTGKKVICHQSSLEEISTKFPNEGEEGSLSDLYAFEYGYHGGDPTCLMPRDVGFEDRPGVIENCLAELDWAWFSDSNSSDYVDEGKLKDGIQWDEVDVRAYSEQFCDAVSRPNYIALRSGNMGDSQTLKSATASKSTNGLIVEAHLGRVKACTECSKAQLVRENNRLRDLLHESSSAISPPIQQQPSQNESVSTSPIAAGARSNASTPERSRMDVDLLRQTTNAAGSDCSPTVLTPERFGWEKINSCFNLFFQYYEKSIPGIFKPEMTPSQYYEKSPFLFWSLVSVGARKYSEDPLLLEVVTRYVMDVAVLSLYSMSNALPAIQAVLLLCLWPLPVNTTVKDPSHALAGAAMQLAVQNGLHVYGHQQDFYRENVECRYADKKFRALLWIHYSDDEPSIDAFINVFDSQIVSTALQEQRDCNQLKKPGILQVFAIACRLIDLYASLDASEGFASYSCHYFARMMLLAAYCILRITKSDLRTCIDLQRGEASFFKAVNLAKRRSTQPCDLDSRNALILTQLWTSHRAFRQKDGTLNGLHLHVRSRLSMSVIFDCFWWWRAEFGGQYFPYGDKDDREVPSVDATEPVRSPLLNWPSGGEEPHEPSSCQLSDLDLQFSAEDMEDFPDWEWAAAFKLPDDIDMSLPDLPDLE
ncbi:MAG: hypothetical protein Q9165_003380 [Trypethelium subeluteriae]